MKIDQVRRIFHVTITLDHIQNAPERELHRMFRNTETGDWLTALEVRTMAVIMKAQGFSVLPSCDHHDEKGYCKGHAKTG